MGADFHMNPPENKQPIYVSNSLQHINLGSYPHLKELVDLSVQDRLVALSLVKVDNEWLLMCMGTLTLLKAGWTPKAPDEVVEYLTKATLEYRWLSKIKDTGE